MLAYFMIHQFLYDYLVVIDNFPKGHVYSHFPEELCVAAYFLDQLELLDHVLIVSAYRNVFNIDQDLIDGYIRTASNFQLELHGADQNLIHFFVSQMELFLLVVYPVQEIFQV